MLLASTIYNDKAWTADAFWPSLAHNPRAVDESVGDGLLLLGGNDVLPPAQQELLAAVRWFDRDGSSPPVDRMDAITLSGGRTPINIQHIRALAGPGTAWVINVPLDTGSGHGLFESPMTVPERRQLYAFANQTAGQVGPTWLAHVGRRGREIKQEWDEAGGATSEMFRLLMSIGVAGEEATRLGLTGWDASTALKAVEQLARQLLV